MFRGVLLVLKRYIPQTAFHSLKNQVHLKDFTVLTYVTAHRRGGGIRCLSSGGESWESCKTYIVLVSCLGKRTNTCG